MYSQNTNKLLQSGQESKIKEIIKRPWDIMNSKPKLNWTIIMIFILMWQPKKKLSLKSFNNWEH